MADMNISLFLSGKRGVWADAENATALMNLCLRHGITYHGFRWGEDGSVFFEVSSFTARRLERLCLASGISARLLEKGGLPPYLWRYRKRAGLILGAIFAVILILLSTRFVWSVRVHGNERMTKAEILSELKSCGFGVGSYIPRVQTEELETRVLIASDRISWIAIHLDGTVAVVQVIENVSPPVSEDRSRPANLVAARDGQIEEVLLYRGNCLVSVGQAVREGELLVSGLYDSATLGYRYTRAAGKIMARTEHRFEIEIPLCYEEKHYEERECREIVLNFFDFSMKIFKNTRNDGRECDIIKEEKIWTLFGRHALPVSFTVTDAIPYRTESAQREPEEALTLAYGELETRLSDFSESGQLLRQDVTSEWTDTSLILHCTVYCIEDIAVQREFEIVD